MSYLFFFACPKKNQKKTPEIDIPADFGEALLTGCSLVASTAVILLLNSLPFNCTVSFFFLPQQLFPKTSNAMVCYFLWCYPFVILLY